MVYRYILKPLLFHLQAERAHHLTTSILGFILSIPIIGHIFRQRYHFEHPSLEKEVMGLKFKSPIGLAAGFDKDGKYYKSMAALGFGFIEIGTVTPVPQKGNPQPRLFRVPEDRALINRMGFNNEGVDEMVDRLKDRSASDLIIGGNIGKNKSTPNDKAVDDYSIAFHKLYPYVDYFVVNVSSPNTPDLRDLQDKAPLHALLSHIMDLRSTKPKSLPVLLKIAPDLTDTQIDDVIEIILDLGVDGIIATNTTISRSDLITSKQTIEDIGPGGLSGRPLTDRSRSVVKYLRDRCPDIAIIGVGGIGTPAQAVSMLAAGADLIQVYSGMVYYGPDLVRDIKKKLVAEN